MIRVGIVGLGKTVSIANNHAKALKADNRVRLTAIYDVDYQLACAWAVKYGDELRVCNSFDELLDVVDAVFICTPNFTHFDYASRALQQDKHTFIEKPLTVNADEAVKLLQISEKSNGFSAVGFIYRHSNIVVAMRQCVIEQIGEVYLINGWLGGKRLADSSIGYEWRMSRTMSGSGALADFGSHLLDLAYFVAYIKFDSAKSMTSTVIDIRNSIEGNVAVDNDDVANFICAYKKTLGSFTASRVGMDELMLNIVGQGGMVQCSLRDSSKLLYWKKDKGGAYDGTLTEIPVTSEDYLDDLFVKQDCAFIDGIQGKQTDIATVADGYYCQLLLDKAEAN